jgi:4-amino-4-deoxy-L-arabinose transferase-like glycosyltransferase
MNHRLQTYSCKIFPFVVLMLVAMAIGTFRLSDSGPLWPDEPRYTNAGAMFHDLFLSGQLLHPYDFAKKNYAQYPAFSIPFHPPAYPATLGVFFVLTTVSYAASRVFISLCAGLLSCFFYAILRRGELSRFVALLCSLLLLSTPEVAKWSRGAMSEIPSSAAIAGASLCFFLWFEKDRIGYCWLAFALAQFAFLCRVTTAGVLPGWMLFIILMGQWRRLLSWRVIVPALLYFVISAGYVSFAAKFARYEVVADGKGGIPLLKNLSYFWVLTPMAFWGTTVLAVLGAIQSLRMRRQFPVGLFFLSWLIGYAVFKLAMPTTPEIRHFFGAMPALAGLAACLFAKEHDAKEQDGKGTASNWKFNPAWVAVVFVLAIGVNAVHAAQFPRGLVGYEAIGRRLASLDQPGNILLCCWEDQDLIFRYRSASPHSQRAMLRGDRLLAIRLPEYAKRETVRLVDTKQGLLDILQRGRARYLVTGKSTDSAFNEKFLEFAFAHEIAGSDSDNFRLIERFPLFIQYGGDGRTGEIFVWEYLGSLPDGPSELNVSIPTANMSISPTH